MGLVSASRRRGGDGDTRRRRRARVAHLEDSEGAALDAKVKGRVAPRRRRGCHIEVGLRQGKNRRAA